MADTNTFKSYHFAQLVSVPSEQNAKSKRILTTKITISLAKFTAVQTDQQLALSLIMSKFKSVETADSHNT
jgi:hypothetical protein